MIFCTEGLLKYTQMCRIAASQNFFRSCESFLGNFRHSELGGALKIGGIDRGLHLECIETGMLRVAVRCGALSRSLATQTVIAVALLNCLCTTVTPVAEAD